MWLPTIPSSLYKTQKRRFILKLMYDSCDKINGWPTNSSIFFSLNSKANVYSVYFLIVAYS